ncbi:ABC transporter substrate-binding protein [Gluconacetobacter azotocaptans]|uniref:ABC transporter substrate-binding protein n=1 Tax=Gluconacetobacter azotocaptans TaxID=142834 RepID=A0A7W4PGL4_9PROT|nr:ABC transporter substrate-binding protein [Gluconacetobacter azotocaptans]MBB2190111.1 ABC transporter substrate-binding protein [Gluconacetobacter azotocaptans]MBM9402910.1 ABC transporter substrate-binding protein [Gluconacetobacter azotocaptans]GBQ26196.1 dipeptide ABC transporter substrate-binding periplasmic protein [Gluconacetobacter azotocaptans DSM 13594]
MTMAHDDNGRIGPAASAAGCDADAVRWLRDGMARGRFPRRDALRMLAVLGAAGATGVAGKAAGAPTPVDTTLRIACHVMEMDDPSAVTSFEPSNIFRNCLEYLVRIDGDGILRPHLAESWAPSDDLRRWDISLRRDVFWSNGDRFEARDVAATIGHWLAPESVSVNKTLFADVRGVEIVHPFLVRIHLARPMLSLPDMLFAVTCPMLHRAFPGSGRPWTDAPVGTGPYRLDHFRVGEEARLIRRAGYWGATPPTRTLRFIDLGQTVSTQLTALSDGQVDILYRMDASDVPLASRLPGVRIVDCLSAQTCCFRMRTDTPPFDDWRVRRAVQLSADNAQMLRLGYADAGSVAANCHVAPFQPDYGPVAPVRRDVAQARHLLADAGHPDGIDLVLGVGNTQGPWEQNTAQVLQQNASDAGIRIRLDVLPPNEYLTIWSDIPFGLTFWSQRPLGMITLDLAYRSGSAWNETRLRNPDFDAALDAAMRSVDPVACRAAMGRAEAILQDSAAIVQPFWQKKFTAVSTRVRGYRLDPADCLDFTSAYLA